VGGQPVYPITSGRFGRRRIRRGRRSVVAGLLRVRHDRRDQSDRHGRPHGRVANTPSGCLGEAVTGVGWPG